ncbi:MAG: hypothetical protein A4E55_01485 [Pelotomaculum sp. PtaU1.Bin035]|nr:MAG: hypothetical protein A4E55_01485 [Pelotomaculum sp. PtaU1.Bin035]
MFKCSQLFKKGMVVFDHDIVYIKLGQLINECIIYALRGD